MNLTDAPHPQLRTHHAVGRTTFVAALIPIGCTLFHRVNVESSRVCSAPTMLGCAKELAISRFVVLLLLSWFQRQQ
jgi:hypothetical protein